MKHPDDDGIRVDYAAEIYAAMMGDTEEVGNTAEVGAAAAVTSSATSAPATSSFTSSSASVSMPAGSPSTNLQTTSASQCEPSAAAALLSAATHAGPSAHSDTPLARELSEITRRRHALAAEVLPVPDKTRVLTVANQKGGVGKTTTTVNLAAALARGGARVLVIDLDPQGNASTALGIDHRAETVSVYEVIINDELIATVIQKSPDFDSLFCVPATIHLAGAEIELVSMVAREQRLRTALEKFLAESEQPFHYVFIDCPPSLGLLTINAFVAAQEVLIPIQCEYYALEGLSQLLTNIKLIERHLNPVLAVSTILLTMFDSRTNLANQVAQEVRDHFPDQVLTTLIPRSVRISEAPSYGQTVISYDANSPGSLSYLEAAAEIAKRGAPQ
ncbi:chromosome partitioning protein [Frigoribacterium sp. CG_9.8]|nr:chromosome partitioning protein [Frigoribacterium sp. CG_9.8]